MARNKGGGNGCAWYVIGAGGLALLFGTETGKTVLIAALTIAVVIFVTWAIVTASSKSSAAEPNAHSNGSTGQSGATDQSGVWQNWNRAAKRPQRPPFGPGDGPGFERHVKALLEELGYQVKLTPGGSDSGVDHVATIRTQGTGVTKVVVQAKNLQGRVGNRAVQEIYTGMGIYRADEAWVVSSNGFTKNAKRDASEIGVKLVTIGELTRRADYVWDTSQHQQPHSQRTANDAQRSASAANPRPAQKESKPSSTAEPSGRQNQSSARVTVKCWKCHRRLQAEAGADGLATCQHCGSRTLVS